MKMALLHLPTDIAVHLCSFLDPRDKYLLAKATTNTAWRQILEHRQKVKPSATIKKFVHPYTVFLECYDGDFNISMISWAVCKHLDMCLIRYFQGNCFYSEKFFWGGWDVSFNLSENRWDDFGDAMEESCPLCI